MKWPEQGTDKLFSGELEHNCQCFQMESVKVSAHLNGWPPFVNGSEWNRRRELSRFRKWRHQPPPFSLCARLIMEGASLAGICMTWPGKLILSKKHLKTPKIMDNFSDRLTLEGAGGQTGDTRSTFRPPLKSLGYNRSN